MEKAVARPVGVGEALRYAHVVRPVTSAPRGWNEVSAYIFMYVCIYLNLYTYLYGLTPIYKFRL